MIRDRRAGSDRRSTVRYAASIEILWESRLGSRIGTISDLSEAGCFVLCSGIVEDDESLILSLPLADGTEILLPATVVNHIYEIGFAARFDKLDIEAQLFLERQLYYLSQTSKPHSGR